MCVVNLANYSAAKMGLVSFTKTLAREGAKYGIHASVIAPMAASAMTETIMPPEMLAGLKVCNFNVFLGTSIDSNLAHVCISPCPRPLPS